MSGSPISKFLSTDPQDVGCEEAMAVLHVYADLLHDGVDPAQRFPGVAAHLRACGPCEDDLEGILALIKDDSRLLP